MGGVRASSSNDFCAAAASQLTGFIGLGTGNSSALPTLTRFTRGVRDLATYLFGEALTLAGEPTCAISEANLWCVGLGLAGLAIGAG